MAPTLALDKAIVDQHLIKNELDRLRKTAPICNRVVSIDVLLSKLEKLTVEVRQIHKIIISTCEPADMAKHTQKLDDVLDNIDAIEIQLQEIRATLATPSTARVRVASLAEVKLPRIELPRFSRKSSEWLSFRDLYITSVHTNLALSDVQKLSYLQGCLQGEASNIIKSIPVSHANYALAWNLLITRYQNVRELTFSIINKLLSSPPMQTDSASSLRFLLDSISECKRQLVTFKLPVGKWDAILGALVLVNSTRQAVYFQQ